jgi:uncharacterized membrane protein YjjB (DUF3815 family)
MVQYLQRFQLVAAPAFSLFCSLDNLRPWPFWDLVVMVVISCMISFAADNTSIHLMFNGSDVISAKGAFAVGFLGNVYSRRFGVAAFGSLVY